ncbi:zinc transport system substrate-binding protein [Desulfocicer vacuolatum DSM 3385]|uniref:Zinc transport system substrate-binding protein n=1 Tax=Desulfocicer vacuolatum DSM 3385 TaxID=1121400 RepID=A0A1W2CJL9_9BACT|nr:zinc ABC transporter substrate-binding protein [Desulfocicer vacuolatum]SMC85437.1 zinc transport system substrate-binding protein [Desulfocicer vacuolatum DSM 3385]
MYEKNQMIGRKMIKYNITAVMVRAFFVFLMGILLIPPAAFGSASGKIEVFVSIAPQAYFIQRIGGEKVAVSVLVPPGKSPATYAPASAQMVKLSRAMALFTIGVPFETALIPKIRAMAPKLSIVDTARGITLRQLDGKKDVLHEPHEHGETVNKEALIHSDEAGHHHHHGAEGNDPHIWMNPLLVKKQAQTMCDSLSTLAPEYEPFFRENLRLFQADLDLLNQKIASILKPLQGETIFVFHPVFGYFADAYGLKQLAVERGGKTPKGRDLVSFIQQAKKNNVRVIFVQPQFDQRVAGKIASAIQGVVVPLDPLARDYIANLSGMALTIQKSLVGQ